MSKERQEQFEHLKSLIRDNKIECLEKYSFQELNNAINICNREVLMHIAARFNNLDAMIFLHKTGLSLDSCDEGDYGPIHFAAFKGHERILEYILENDPRMINMTSSTNYTPLHCAAEDKHIKTMIYLLTKGADLHAESDYYGTPFKILKDEYSDLEYHENMSNEEAINILERLQSSISDHDNQDLTKDTGDTTTTSTSYKDMTCLLATNQPDDDYHDNHDELIT